MAEKKRRQGNEGTELRGGKAAEGLEGQGKKSGEKWPGERSHGLSSRKVRRQSKRGRR